MENLELQREEIFKTIEVQTIENCGNCNSKDLVPIKQHEHSFSDDESTHDGFVCDNCKCFNYIDEDGYSIYEYSYSRDVEKKVSWKINDN